MVAVSNPLLGETLLDPACDTGGFLVETYQHLEKQCKTVQDRRILQERSISGGEAKTLDDVFDEVRAIRDGGANGSIIGRNTFQRPKADALDMLNRIIKIYKGQD